jgi:hypothetical protein
MHWRLTTDVVLYASTLGWPNSPSNKCVYDTCCREQLVDTRYQKLTSALEAINEKLGGIYRQLTGNVGDAYCSYTAERRLLFSEGIVLNVR